MNASRGIRNRQVAATTSPVGEAQVARDLRPVVVGSAALLCGPPVCRDPSQMGAEPGASRLAVSHYRMVLLRSCWQAFLKVCREKKKASQDDMLGMCFAAFRIQRTCFSVWRQYTESKQNSNQLSEMALQFWYLHTVQSALRGWSLVINAESKIEAMQRSRVLLRGHFVLWMRYTSKSKETLSQVSKAHLLHKVHLLNSTFLEWKNYTIQKTAQHSQSLIAENHYEQSLMAKAFFALRWMVQVSSDTEEQVAWFIGRQKKHNLQAYWNAWVKCTAETLPDGELSKIGKAVRKHNLQQLKMCFYAWSTFTESNKIQKGRIIVAQIRARDKVLSSFMRSWSAYSERSVLIRYIFNQVSEIHHKHILHYMFQQWVSVWQRTYQLRIAQFQASQHYDQTLLGVYLQVWRATAHSEAVSNSNRYLAVNHYQNKLKCTLLSNWIVYYQEKIHKHEQAEKAILFHRQRVLVKCLKYWRDHVELFEKRRDLKIKAAVFWIETIKRNFVTHWSQCASLAVGRHKKSLRAHNFHQQQLLKKYWERWVECRDAISHKHKLRILLLHAVVETLKKRKKQRLLLAWIKWHNSKMTEKMKMSQAEDFHAMTLKRNSLICFSVVAAQYKQKEEKKLRADNLNAWFLAKKTFDSWNSTTIYEKEKRSQMHLSFVQWSLRLKGSILEAWGNVVSLKMHKKRREKDAFQYFHYHLLQDIARQWLHVIKGYYT
ncbi:hypothetical protein Pelo_7709 [Pelomyxa schiedti]|nr:hypothetical protein Pelo_7709 [Pelomyxa schiedti]